MGNLVNIGIGDLRNLTGNLKKGLNDQWLAPALAEIQTRVLAKLYENMAKYELLDTEIASSVRVYVFKKKIFIDIANTYAMFVEYGTGIVGSENPHPNPKVKNWIYDVNAHGELGWWYPCDENIKTRYPNIATKTINGQVYAHTKGQKSRPFLYETYRYAARITTPTLNRYFKKQLNSMLKG